MCIRDSLWEDSVVFVEKNACGFLQIADAVVVAEAFPCFEEGGFVGSGEGGEVGELGEEELEAFVLPHGGDGGLLKHDLGDHDGVGVGGAAPRVIESVFAEPTLEGVLKGAFVAERVLGGWRLQVWERLAIARGRSNVDSVCEMARTTYTVEISEEGVEVLRGVLERDGFEFSEKPYAHYSAKKGKLNVTVYEKGPKVLVQGKETEDFVQFTLEPEVLGEARLGYEELHNPEMFEPHFGIDESGKGDFFGPLVIAGAYVDQNSARALLDAGVMDSKKIAAGRITKLAEVIRSLPGVAHAVVSIGPERYNELYRSFRNLNELLAWGHAKVISELVGKVPACPRALSDQFANPRVLERALAKQEIDLVLQQRTKGESDVAVAAASILARDRFVRWLQDAEKEWDMKFPLGAGEQVLQAGRSFFDAKGAEKLHLVSKEHFKTTDKVTGNK